MNTLINKFTNYIDNLTHNEKLQIFQVILILLSLAGSIESIHGINEVFMDFDGQYTLYIMFKIIRHISLLLLFIGAFIVCIAYFKQYVQERTDRLNNNEFVIYMPDDFFAAIDDYDSDDDDVAVVSDNTNHLAPVDTSAQ